MDTSANNKRIAKNTILLYFRMGIIMLVQLFTSRVVLQQLGVEDYGIYNVVGGVVAMFGFINSAMTSATSRYITFSLGEGNSKKQSIVFCSSINIHVILSIVIFVLAETIGLWYVCTKLVVAPDRYSAALWVYHFSVVATLVMVMSVPYNSVIVAHEKMSAFAYISIIEVFLKLIIVYLLMIAPCDKLIFFSALILLVQLLIRCCYTIYCNRNFSECRYQLCWDSKLLKEMAAFAVWSFWGNFAAGAYTQGLNLMLNLFFGPVVNAARAISVQVQHAVNQFVTNFQMALNPQITKQYAQGEMNSMFNLMHRSARFSFFLLLLLVVPIQIEAEKILSIWLVTVPENTVIFIRVMLSTALVYTLSNPLIILAQATGKVRKYQFVAGGVLLTIVPVSYLCLQAGLPAYSVFIVHFVIEFFDLFVRMYLLRSMCGLSMREYIRKVCLVVFKVAFLSYAIVAIIKIFIPNSIIYSIILILSSFIISSLIIYHIGLTKNERNQIKIKVYHIFANKE